MNRLGGWIKCDGINRWRHPVHDCRRSDWGSWGCWAGCQGLWHNEASWEIVSIEKSEVLDESILVRNLHQAMQRKLCFHRVSCLFSPRSVPHFVEVDELKVIEVPCRQFVVIGLHHIPWSISDSHHHDRNWIIGSLDYCTGGFTSWAVICDLPISDDN